MEVFTRRERERLVGRGGRPWRRHSAGHSWHLNCSRWPRVPTRWLWIIPYRHVVQGKCSAAGVANVRLPDQGVGERNGPVSVCSTPTWPSRVFAIWGRGRDKLLWRCADDQDFCQSLEYVSFDNMTFYDPSAKEWFWQTTTGDIPGARMRYCAVSAAGFNGTYDM